MAFMLYKPPNTPQSIFTILQEKQNDRRVHTYMKCNNLIDSFYARDTMRIRLAILFFFFFESEKINWGKGEGMEKG